MTEAEALEIVGGLSKTSKMPCPSYSIPATECKVGTRLRDKENSVCKGCYAMRGFYRMGNVARALRRRLDSLDDPRWVEAMILLIKPHKFFRWHDSGDIQNAQHLSNIVSVCLGTSNTSHWLPTKEYKMVRDYLSTNVFPDNLVVRVSSPMVDQPPLKAYDFTHTAINKGGIVHGFECDSFSRGHKCGDCRACWDSTIDNVTLTFY